LPIRLIRCAAVRRNSRFASGESTTLARRLYRTTLPSRCSNPRYRREAGGDLPSYSPDLNPIKMALAKLKATLRKAAAGSIGALVDAIASALVAFSAQECLNFSAAAGYDRV